MSTGKSKVELEATVLEGIMTEGYTEGTEISLECGAILRTTDGSAWRVLSSKRELIEIVNPRGCGTAKEFVSSIETAVNREPAEGVF
jgi:hypothetical protein